MKKITLTYCGMEGEGATVKAAKQDAAAKIERVLNENYSPRVVSYGQVSWLIWREPTTCGHVGIRSARIPNASRGESLWAGCCYHAANQSMDEVQSQVMIHVAQQTWDGESDTHPLLEGRNDLAGQFKSWATFQKRYAHARECGMNDNEAHHFAGNALYLLAGRSDLTRTARSELERTAS